MVAEACLDGGVRVDGLSDCAGGELERCVLKGPHHRAPCHPTKVALRRGERTLVITATMIGFDDALRHLEAHSTSKHALSVPPLLTPCLALSSLKVAATSLNFPPSLSFSIASIAFECFSHKMCRTWGGGRGTRGLRGYNYREHGGLICEGGLRGKGTGNGSMSVWGGQVSAVQIC